MVRPAYFIPETKKCSQLFKELKERRLQIAIIVDEYGGTAGGRKPPPRWRGKGGGKRI